MYRPLEYTLGWKSAALVVLFLLRLLVREDLDPEDDV